MKKWIALLLSLFSIVALSGCGPAEKSTTSSTTAPTEPVLKPAAKPVIYLYPEKEQPVSVHLLYDGELTCTYPEYGTGWNVIAKPDGTLLDANGTSYNYLYWEGLSSNSFDFSEGFCVPGKDTAAFLEDVLQKPEPERSQRVYRLLAAPDAGKSLQSDFLPNGSLHTARKAGNHTAAGHPDSCLYGLETDAGEGRNSGADL